MSKEVTKARILAALDKVNQFRKDVVDLDGKVMLSMGRLGMKSVIADAVGIEVPRHEYDRTSLDLNYLGVREVPDAHCKAIERGLPNSSATALEVVDLRPYFFGLTLPPRAVALLPNANIRKPSFLILIAALMSRSCRCPQ